MLNIFQYICEATGAVLATGALSEIFDGIKENVDACVFQNGLFVQQEIMIKER